MRNLILGALALLLSAPLSAQQVPSPRVVATGGVTYEVTVDAAVVSTHSALHTAQAAAVTRFLACQMECTVRYRIAQEWRIEEGWIAWAGEPEPTPDPEPAPTPEPLPPSGNAFWMHDWNSYSGSWPVRECSSPYAASDEASAPQCPRDVGWIFTGGNGMVTIETGARWDGSTGKFLRVRYDGDDHEETRGVDLVMPRPGGERPREIWGEVWMRFPATWRIPTDDKTFFALPNTHARWNLNIDASGFYGGPPGNGDVRTSVTRAWAEQNIWNGQWGRLRFHYRMSTTPTVANGIYQVWWNGTVLADFATRSDHGPNDYFAYFALGRNANVQGGGYRDWGRVSIWLSSPGW